MFTLTKCSNFTKLYGTNSTASSITVPAPTTTAPTGDGVFDLRGSGPAGEVPNFGELIFYGAGADEGTGTAKVILWHQCGTLWIPTVAVAVDLLLGTAVGVAGADLVATDRLVDSITPTAGAVNVASMDVLSPNDNTVAKVSFDLRGASKIQVLTAKGSATNLNVLFRGF
jgi:hypothetical protein